MLALEQHFTTDMALFRDVLAKANLRNRSVLEIGAGTGVVTSALLDLGAKVTSFEITSGLCKVRHPKLDLRERNVLNVDLSFMDWDCIVSIPPYSLLPWISKLIQDFAVGDAILVVPKKPGSLVQFPDFETKGVLPGSAFEPPTNGNHLIIQRGFDVS